MLSTIRSGWFLFVIYTPHNNTVKYIARGDNTHHVYIVQRTINDWVGLNPELEFIETTEDDLDLEHAITFKKFVHEDYAGFYCELGMVNMQLIAYLIWIRYILMIRQGNPFNRLMDM